MNLINLELENMEISRNVISRQCNLIKFSNVTDIYVVQKRSVSSSVVFGFGSKWSCLFFFERGLVKETLNMDKSANKLLQGA